MADLGHIETFERLFEGKSHAEVAFLFAPPTGDRSGPSGAVANAPSVVAEVYQGRWLARCPFCAGAEYVNFETGLFFCCGCRNAAVDYAYVKVTRPNPTNRAAVEAYLLSRPDHLMRNFLRGETVADLRDQNRALKLPLIKAEG